MDDSMKITPNLIKHMKNVFYDYAKLRETGLINFQYDGKGVHLTSRAFDANFAECEIVERERKDDMYEKHITIDGLNFFALYDNEDGRRSI